MCLYFLCDNPGLAVAMGGMVTVLVL